MEPGELDDIFADQIGEVLAPPALGIVRVVHQAGFREPATSHQALQRGGRGSALLFAPLAYRNRVQTKSQIAPGQGIPALTPGFHPGVAAHQQRGPWRVAIHHALEPVFPFRHLVDLVHDQEAASGIPALSPQDGAIRPNVPIEVLGWLKALHDVSAKRGLADLPRAGHQHHLAVQIGCNEVIRITFHGDFFNE